MPSGTTIRFSVGLKKPWEPPVISSKLTVTDAIKVTALTKSSYPSTVAKNSFASSFGIDPVRLQCGRLIPFFPDLIWGRGKDTDSSLPLVYMAVKIPMPCLVACDQTGVRVL